MKLCNERIIRVFFSTYHQEKVDDIVDIYVA